MKKITIILVILGTFLALSCIIIVNKVKDKIQKVSQIEMVIPVLQDTVTKTPEKSKKEKLLQAYTQDQADLLLMIDLLDEKLKLTHQDFGPYITVTKKTGEDWFISEPYKILRQSKVIHEETGEIIGVNERLYYLGTAYLKSVTIRELWVEYIYRDIYKDRSVTMNYGVLLEADTIGSKIFLHGTFVFCKFSDSNLFDQQRVLYTYHENYRDLETVIKEEMDKIYDWDLYSDMLGYSLVRISVDI